VLAGCAVRYPALPPGAAEPARPAAEAAPPALRSQPASRWVAAGWADLPGWPQDSVLAAWPALLRSCDKPAPDWAATCASARALAAPDEPRVRAWLQAQLQPWRVEAPDGAAEGLITGYYEPLIEASRRPRPGFQVPLYAPPADLATRRPWYTRSQIETDPAARAALRGREIAYLADPLDALVLHIQGSGRLALTEPDGSRRLLRAAFAGHNDQPYQSVGRWLVERGAFTLEQASWPAIKGWARANPARVAEMIQANPRYVFFREEALPDPTQGPLGAQGVALTPGRSIAVDKGSVPYGTPVWIATTEPQAWSATPPPARPLQRLVLAQDTGGAIVGAVRADYFWGWGEGADELAGRMKQPLRMWALWPKAGAR
jgi:membrane-bound lytic murein transglycosylase A